MSVVFATLGPEGTCHEYATMNYIRFQGIEDASIDYVDNFLVALERLRSGEIDFIVQNSAHPQVFEVTEKYFREVFVIDTFLFPTKAMGVLTRIDIHTPKVLGLMPATRGYIDTSQYEELVFETANPIVARNLLAGKYDSGFTFLHYADDHPGRFRVDKVIGEVDTAWLVYGCKRRCKGKVIGVHDPSLFIKA